jgi:hypothetical protein
MSSAVVKSAGIRIASAIMFAATVVTCVTTQAGQSWLGCQIMPKSDQFQIEAREEKEHSGGIFDIAWPATVEKTNGRWLFIRDEGGYSNPPVAGWVYADNVLRIESSADHYSDELQSSKAAWLYWLRGIYWENKNEPVIALTDYQAAAAIDPKLDDVQIRLGRLTARRSLKSGTARYLPENRATWEQHFANAQSSNPRRAQVYLDWGIALSQACKCSVTAAQTKDTAAEIGEEASDNGTRAQVRADDADAAATVANAEINAVLKGIKASKDPDRTKAKTKAAVAGTHGNKAAAAAENAINAANTALEAAMHAADFGAPLLDFDGEDSAAERPAPEYSDDDIAIAEETWPGSTKYLKSVNQARNAAFIASKAAKRGWKQADNAFNAHDQFPTAEPRADAAETIPPPSGAAATADPYFGAGQSFEAAAARSSHWWRIPVARGEFFLNQCSIQNRQGETAWNNNLNVSLLAKLIGSDEKDPNKVKFQAMELAIELFNNALQLNPSSPDAYRDRAEALRLEARLSNNQHRPQEAKSHLVAALESATSACALGNYRQTGSLKTLAEITHDLKLDDSAADYAEKAYACSSLEDRPITENLFRRYYALVAPPATAGGASAAGGVITGTIGQVASRGHGNDDDSGEPSAPEANAGGRSELPPGFIFRSP